MKTGTAALAVMVVLLLGACSSPAEDGGVIPYIAMPFGEWVRSVGGWAPPTLSCPQTPGACVEDARAREAAYGILRVVIPLISLAIMAAGISFAYTKGPQGRLAAKTRMTRLFTTLFIVSFSIPLYTLLMDLPLILVALLLLAFAWGRLSRGVRDFSTRITPPAQSGTEPKKAEEASGAGIGRRRGENG